MKSLNLKYKILKMQIGLNPSKEICQVECDVLKEMVEDLQNMYNNVEIVLFMNIISFGLFYFYEISKNKKWLNENYINLIFLVTKYYFFLVLSFNLFYFYLFII